MRLTSQFALPQDSNKARVQEIKKKWPDLSWLHLTGAVTPKKTTKVRP